MDMTHPSHCDAVDSQLLDYYHDESRFAGGRLSTEELNGQARSISADCRWIFTRQMLRAASLNAVQIAECCRDIMVRCQVINYTAGRCGCAREEVWGFLVELRGFYFEYYPIYKEYLDRLEAEPASDTTVETESGVGSDGDVPIHDLD